MESNNQHIKESGATVNRWRFFSPRRTTIQPHIRTYFKIKPNKLWINILRPDFYIQISVRSKYLFNGRSPPIFQLEILDTSTFFPVTYIERLIANIN